MRAPAVPRLRRLAVLGLLCNLGAAADDVPARPMQIEERQNLLLITVAMPELADAALHRRMQSGFASTIVVRAFVYREGESKPAWATVRTVRVAFDLWEEVYTVQIRDAQGERNLRLKTEAQALAPIARLEGFPIAPVSAVPRQLRHFVAVLVEVNPISPELLAQVRRWLAHPGSSERISGGESFLGSFVSVFLNNQVSEAERVVKFRSQPFYRPEVKR